MLNLVPLNFTKRLDRMVIDEPDSYELENSEDLGIGIFEPGKNLEGNMDWSHFSRVLIIVAAGWGMMILIEIFLIFPIFFFTGIEAIFTDPWVLIYLSVAEVGFIIPIVRYLDNRGLSLKSVGIKDIKSTRNIQWGIGVGLLMIGANLLISYIMTIFVPEITQGDEILFVIPEGALAGIWLLLWTIVMFIIVGFCEEVIFRGFLQRRMEMFYQRRGSKNYKLVALVLTSFIFAVIHLDIFGLATRFVLGLFLGYLAQKRNYSIIGPSIAHGLNNSIVVYLAFLVV
ncbi:CPBP family intramembrane metalloprotease [Candidatus Thorarchaeota archaeon]|nr:MAG: CPBP family intramembrane metalloprotease [Candidatus Thorarchaeota archaeon]